MKLFDRIDISQIFIKHFATLYDHRALTLHGKRRMSFEDIFTFLLFPLFTSLILVILFDLFINDNYLNIIITSLSIFVGLLFGFLTLVYDIVKTERVVVLQKDVTHEQKIKFRLVKELFINIAFAIALSILSIFATLLTRFSPKIITALLKELDWYMYIKKGYQYTTNVLAIFLIILFIATLLMILKRFFIIFINEFNNTDAATR